MANRNLGNNKSFQVQVSWHNFYINVIWCILTERTYLMCARGGPWEALKNEQKEWATVTFILNGRFINKAGAALFLVCYGLVNFNTFKHCLKEHPADFVFLSFAGVYFA